MFTEFITPVELMNFYNVAMEIERAKEEKLENAKREGYK
jgi:hypothetical protein